MTDVIGMLRAELWDKPYPSDVQALGAEPRGTELATDLTSLWEQALRARREAEVERLRAKLDAVRLWCQDMVELPVRDDYGRGVNVAVQQVLWLLDCAAGGAVTRE